MDPKLVEAREIIKKKLAGKKLTYREIYAVMDQIAKKRLGDVLTTYFVASDYANGFTKQELYDFTKAMVETGETLHFKGIVADKHSIGGIPGTRTTLIVVPIVAAAGFTIPKSSSRAITTPGGTADDMEVLAPVELSKKRIYEVVKETNACIVWGGSFKIAPADDVMITVEETLMHESYDKILISIMAKKVAFGSNHVVIDLPYGKTVKVPTLKDAQVIKEKFEYLARKFDIKIKVLIHKTDQPAGRGIGPILETREALRVLQQKKERPLDLEVRSLHLAGNLLDLCLEDTNKSLQEQIKKEYGNGIGWATYILQRGLAFKKMQQIIKAQGGDSKLDSEDLKPGKYSLKVVAKQAGKVEGIRSKNATVVAKVLGAPNVKGAGIYLEKKIGESVKKGDVLYILYTEEKYHLEEAKETLLKLPILEV